MSIIFSSLAGRGRWPGPSSSEYCCPPSLDTRQRGTGGGSAAILSPHSQGGRGNVTVEKYIWLKKEKNKTLHLRMI